MAWAHHPSTLVAEAGGLYVPGQHGLLGDILPQNKQSLVGWCIAIIPALGRLDWEDLVMSETSLSYTVSSRQARIPKQDPVSKIKRKEGRRQEGN